MSLTPDALNVVGVVIQAAPHKYEAVIAAVTALPGVDIHTTTGDGRIIATAIDTDETMAIDQLASMNRIPGIVSTMLAYHQIERPELEPTAPPCGCSPQSDHSCIS